MKAWSLTQLAQAKVNDLKQCNTDIERQLCNVICNKEIRNLAETIQKQRKLTPGEQAILNNLS